MIWIWKFFITWGSSCGVSSFYLGYYPDGEIVSEDNELISEESKKIKV